MLQDIFTRYRGGCMMLLRREGDSVVFLGTAFLVHPDGYLLTVAQSVQDQDNLMVAQRDFGLEFAPMVTDTISTYDAAVCQVDEARDLALLKFENDVEIALPDHIIGMSHAIVPGSHVGLIGYSFGFNHVFNQFIKESVVCSKVVTRAGANLLLFDGVVNLGMRGAPLIAQDDGRVIGLVHGRFDPVQAGIADSPPAEQPYFSYAVSIEYAAALLHAEGRDVV